MPRRLPRNLWAAPGSPDTFALVMTAVLPDGSARRVLIGDFGAIATLGLRELLEDGCEIVAAGAAEADLTSLAQRKNADVVLVDLDSPHIDAITTQFHDEQPNVTVIACSLSEPRLSVVSGPGASYTAELEPSSLLEAVNGR